MLHVTTGKREWESRKAWFEIGDNRERLQKPIIIILAQNKCCPRKLVVKVL